MTALEEKKKCFKWKAWFSAPWQANIREVVEWILYFCWNSKPFMKEMLCSVSRKLNSCRYLDAETRAIFLHMWPMGHLLKSPGPKLQTTWVPGLGPSNLHSNKLSSDLYILEITEPAHWLSDSGTICIMSAYSKDQRIGFTETLAPMLSDVIKK